MLEGAAQKKSSDISKLLVSQILLFLLSQFRKGRTGNGHRNVLPFYKKNAVNGIAVPGGNGREQMYKPDFHGRGEGVRADLKRRNDIAHIVIYPFERS
jgi:hypothetical protein